MASFLRLVNVPDAVRHALDVIRREIDRQLEGEQRPSLVPSTGVEESVRRSLEIIDAHIQAHTADLGKSARQRFWEVLHEQAQRLAEQA